MQSSSGSYPVDVENRNSSGSGQTQQNRTSSFGHNISYRSSGLGKHLSVQDSRLNGTNNFKIGTIQEKMTETSSIFSNSESLANRDFSLNRGSFGKRKPISPNPVCQEEAKINVQLSTISESAFSSENPSAFAPYKAFSTQSKDISMSSNPAPTMMNNTH